MYIYQADMTVPNDEGLFPLRQSLLFLDRTELTIRNLQLLCRTRIKKILQSSVLERIYTQLGQNTTLFLVCCIFGSAHLPRGLYTGVTMTASDRLRATQ